MRLPLIARFVIDKVENHAEMHEPQGGWKKLLRFLADACFGNGFAEDGHALRALHLGTFPENGEGVLRVCRVAKERSEEAPVVLQNFQFRMEDDAEAFAKARLSFPFFRTVSAWARCT